jgi:branched-chain amino acid aminotransferase
MTKHWQFTREHHPAPTSQETIANTLESPGFGLAFTDNMVTARWNPELEWHDIRLGPRRPFLIDPACAVLHYGQEVFEGMKAYKTDGNTAMLFRPEENARRFQLSAERLAMPPVPDTLFIQSIEELVKADRNWIPSGDASLYLRPFMFASESFLGVRASREYIFCVIASPAGPYFSKGKTAVTVWISREYTRASPGGTGAAKCGGNYAASLLAQAKAKGAECDQVVFLDALEHRWIEELGGMNIFFVMADGTLVTPPLSGTILPGITRDSVIKLARSEGRIVEERPYSFEELLASAKSGQLSEVFACGTAAVISAVGRLRYEGGECLIGDGEAGVVTTSLRERLTGIQRGLLEDGSGWVHRIDN